MSAFLDPRSAALMTLGGGLLAGSGPSRIPQSTGAILGQATGPTMQAYQGAAQLQLQELTRQQLAQLQAAQTGLAQAQTRAANRDYQLQGAAISELFGGGATGAPGPVVPGMLSGAPTSAAGASGAPGQGVAPTGPGGAPMPVVSDPTRKAMLADLAFNGGKRLSQLMMDGNMRVIPRVGLVVRDPQSGQWALAPGLAEEFARMKYNEEYASGLAKAQTGAEKVELSGGGYTYKTPAELVGLPSSGMPNAPGMQAPPSVAPTTAPGAPGTLPPSMPGFPREQPAQRNDARSKQRAILSGELNNERALLARAPNDEARAHHQKNIAEITKELANLSGKTGAGASGAQGVGTRYGSTHEEIRKREAEKAGDIERAKLDVKRMAEYEDTATKMLNGNNIKIAKIQRIMSLLGDHEGGALTGAGFQIARLARSIGFDIGDVSNKEAAQALRNEFALSLRNTSEGAGMPGALSDRDREFLVAMIPGMDMSANGRKLIAETFTKLWQREQEVSRMMFKYIKKHGKLDRDFFTQLDSWSQANPVFPQ